MKMKVQEYLEAHGPDQAKAIQALVDEFKIKVNDYPDRVVLNYDQIESPKFNPIVDECRGLILWKKGFDIAARSYTRFWNVGEDPKTNEFPILSPSTRSI